MWQQRTKKTLFTLNVDDYAPQITELTYPFLEHYARKIGAEFVIISTRKFPDYEPVYEKLQIYEIAQNMGNDWNLYFDSDAFINPEFFDITTYLPPDMVLHNGADNAGNRWVYDRFFQRDGRHIGSCNWFTVASSLCIELWKPLDDISYEEAISRIVPTCFEHTSGVRGSHLIDDFVLSRNIAKYGLKFATLSAIQAKISDKATYLWHKYTISLEQKRHELKQTIKQCMAIDYLPPRLRDEVFAVELDGKNCAPPGIPEYTPMQTAYGGLRGWEGGAGGNYI